MKKELISSLRLAAKKAAKEFSNPNRFRNPTGEIFEVEDFVVLSEGAAAVIYRKNTKKRALMFFYWLNTRNGYWQYFVPTDSHLLGMRQVEQLKYEIEQSNFGVEVDEEDNHRGA